MERHAADRAEAAAIKAGKSVAGNPPFVTYLPIYPPIHLPTDLSTYEYLSTYKYPFDSCTRQR